MKIKCDAAAFLSRRCRRPARFPGRSRVAGVIGGPRLRGHGASGVADLAALHGGRREEE